MSKSKQSSLMMAILPSLVLYIAAFVLVFLSREDLASTLPYWEFFIPLVAVFSLMSGWGQADVFNRSRLFYLVKQILHWGALGGLLWMFGEIGIRDALNASQYNILQIYLLTFAALIAGLYLDAKLFFFGAFLLISAYSLSDAQHFDILAIIGEQLGVSDAQNKPVTLLAILAALGFAASALILMAMRSGILAKRK